jgi:hypothetical protein
MTGKKKRKQEEQERSGIVELNMMDEEAALETGRKPKCRE